MKSVLVLVTSAQKPTVVASMLRRNYRHIIWDWNGTLLDDLDLTIDIMNGLLAPRRLPLLDRHRYHEVFDFPVRAYYGKLGFDLATDTFERLSVEFIEAYDRRRWEAQLHLGAESLLAGLVAGGRTQSILSAYRHPTLVEIVGHFGLTKHFVRLNGLDNIYAHSKLELGRSCLAELAIPAREVLLVGDTLHDLEVAGALGLDCVLVSHGHHPAARLRARTPHVIDDLAALAQHFEVPASALPVTPPRPAVAAKGFSDPENPVE